MNFSINFTSKSISNNYSPNAPKQTDKASETVQSDNYNRVRATAAEKTEETKNENPVLSSSQMEEVLSDFDCIAHPKYSDGDYSSDIFQVTVNGEFMMVSQDTSTGELTLTRFDSSSGESKAIGAGKFKQSKDLIGYLKILNSGDLNTIKTINKQLGIKNEAVPAGDYQNGINDFGDINIVVS